MFVRISVLAGFAASLLAISTANGAGPQRDLSYRNPNDGKTYGFVQCRWKKEPKIREVAGKGGMFYLASGGIAECLPEGGVGAYVTSSDWTQITNVHCQSNDRAKSTNVRWCLQNADGGLEARDGYFTIGPTPPPAGTTSRQRSGGGSGNR